MKPRILPCFSLLVLVCFAAGLAAAQENHVSTVTAPSSAVPGFISYSGVLKDFRGQIRTGVTGVTFLLYRDEQTGSAPLWMETQSVVPDATGHFSVQLGATTAAGIPAELFQAGAARWLAAQIAGEPEPARVLLVSVPYAMKAGDAETIGGLPPSAFMLALPTAAGAVSAAAVAPASTPVNPTVTGAGTVGSIPLWDLTSDLTSSIMTQTGSGSTARVGINITTPAATLDVKGTSNFRGTVGLPSAGIATATGGKTSYPLAFVASAFNSSTKAAVSQNFRWQAEPVGNNTASPTGTLNLLFGVGTSTPAETGLSIANNGQITFASGQTFPGTGSITGVTAGTDLTGGGASGTVTLNLDTTKVPQLAAANTFTGDQTVNGNLSATGVVTGSGFQIGSSLFAFGSSASGSAFLGFAGNTTSAGLGLFNTAAGYLALFSNNGSAHNTAIGEAALYSNTQGSWNTAIGKESLFVNSTGWWNTALGATALDGTTSGSNNTGIGYNSLGQNTTGSSNTAVGFFSGGTNDDSLITGSNNTLIGLSSVLGTGSLTNATAIGSNSLVAVNNALVLGSINGVNQATVSTNVGIGIAAPQFTLDIHGGMLHDGGNVPQTPSAQGAYLDWNALTGTTGETDLINNQGNGLGGFAFMNTPLAGTPLSTLMFISGAGKVGIGTTAPDSLLTVNGSADKPSGGSWGTYSDARLKTLHGNYTAGLSQIMKLHPIRYRYKDGNGMNIRDRDEHVGFVAQDVQRVIPEAVTTNSSGYLLVNNDPILWTMLNAIQQQQAEIRSLRTQLSQTAAVSKPQARPASSTQSVVPNGKMGKDNDQGKDKDQELRRVRAELEGLRKKDARLEDRLARLEQVIGEVQKTEPAVASAETATTQPGR